ncbi:MAG: FAD-dependent monooxygenase [Xanthobacteraceae bacterium]
MTDFDVAVVGYGPTGLTAASLLGQLGHRVVVIERWPTLYGLPRLTHIDGETARLHGGVTSCVGRVHIKKCDCCIWIKDREAYKSACGYWRVVVGDQRAHLDKITRIIYTAVYVVSDSAFVSGYVNIRKFLGGFNLYPSESCCRASIT